MCRWKNPNILIMFFLVSLVYGSFFTSGVHAQSADELKSKIDDRNTQIKKLEEEINQYNIEVSNAQSQAKTLQSTIKTLDLTKKKITTDITLTSSKIDKTTLTIQQLGNQIDTNKKAIISGIQNLHYLDDAGMVESVLSNRNISDMWNEVDDITQIQTSVREKSAELSKLQNNMQGQKKSLVTLKQDLTGKKQAVESTAQEKATVLALTKNKEQAFQALVKTKEQERAEFEKEVTDFEAQLHLLIDTSSYPGAQHSILSWPVDNAPTQIPCDTAHKVVSCIVRGFFRPVLGSNGLTISAGHNGVDFRASTGTSVKNVLGGVVAGTGNTDLYKGCYGLGKWVMVNHPNGLSTIYMHLSVISVSQGQNLATGDLIGLSGNTGNSEAPHLHVSVYATQGVRIEQFVNSIGCKQAVVPLADPKAYLDPLAYFPSI